MHHKRAIRFKNHHARVLTQSLMAILILSTAHVSQADIDISQDLSDLTDAERAWFEDDSTLNAIAISSGELNWLAKEKTDGQYGLENNITLPLSALTDGWVNFTQCHNNLDPIQKIVVKYNAKNTRGLTLTKAEKIDAVQIDDNNQSAVLFGVKKQGRVCISGESRSLEKTDNGYMVKRGPFMRKFLDGYYPMSLKETINWSQTALKLNTNDLQPHLGKAYEYSNKTQTLIAQYWFEGRLSPKYLFQTE